MKRLAVVLLALLLCMCAQSDIRQKVIDSLEKVRTYGFRLEVISNTTLGNVTMSSISNSTGVIDLVNRTLHMNTTTVVDRFGFKHTSKTETFVFNDTAYIRVYTKNGTKLIKTNVSGDFWRRSNSMEQLIELLKISKVTNVSSGIVGGVECYVLNLKPDAKKISQNVSHLKEINVKLFVSKKTFYPVKAEVTSVVVTPMTISMGSLKGNVSVVHRIKTVEYFYDINEPVKIERPR